MHPPPGPKSPGEKAAVGGLLICMGLIGLTLHQYLPSHWFGGVTCLVLGVLFIIAALVQITRWGR